VAVGTWVVLPALLLVLSGCGETSPCRYGGEDSAAALEEFLAEAAAGDQAGSSALLSNGWELDQDAFASLTARLDGVDLAALRLLPEQAGTMFSYRVMDQDTLLGEFNVITGGGCARISWGEYTETPEVEEPAVSPSAAP
jgi:hypothetical protein